MNSHSPFEASAQSSPPPANLAFTLMNTPTPTRWTGSALPSSSTLFRMSSRRASSSHPPATASIAAERLRHGELASLLGCAPGDAWLEALADGICGRAPSAPRSPRLLHGLTILSGSCFGGGEGACKIGCTACAATHRLFGLEGSLTDGGNGWPLDHCRLRLCWMCSRHIWSRARVATRSGSICKASGNLFTVRLNCTPDRVGKMNS